MSIDSRSTLLISVVLKIIIRFAPDANRLQQSSQQDTIINFGRTTTSNYSNLAEVALNSTQNQKKERKKGILQF